MIRPPMMSWPSLNMSASTTNVSPTSRLTGYRPPSSSGVTFSMTTDRHDAGAVSTGPDPFADLAMLAALDVLRGAVTAPADAGAAVGTARTRDAGLRAGVVMHSGYHHHVPAVAILAHSIGAPGGRTALAGRPRAPERPPGRPC